MRARHVWSVVAVGLVLLLSAACTVSVAQPEKPEAEGTLRTISVSGYGEAMGEPDMASIQLGVNITGAELGQAVDDSNTAMEAVKAAVLEQGVEAKDIQTSNYSVWIETRYDPQTGQPTGEIFYHVDSTLQVTVREVGKMSDVLGAALDAGANSVFGITFGIQETEELSAVARTNAMEDAKARAEQLAEGMGVTLGQPTSITEYLSGGGVIPVAREAAVGMRGGGAPPISSGQLTVSVQVEITFELLTE